ncbi:unnamed protein product [Natator depressus]
MAASCLTDNWGQSTNKAAADRPHAAAVATQRLASACPHPDFTLVPKLQGYNVLVRNRCLLKLFHQFLLQTLWRDLLLHMQILTELTIFFLKSEALKPTSCFL